ncbi:hypothetical protein Taro_046573 [Colocasia esculenta]|uniref:Uncharacterized protein n=1 Tax=Colocasia esculenta TaxID=4460 RepID=A0A843X4B6_COLES|nr:hypothetical protein [Colocasia esculenta]
MANETCMAVHGYVALADTAARWSARLSQRPLGGFSGGPRGGAVYCLESSLHLRAGAAVGTCQVSWVQSLRTATLGWNRPHLLSSNGLQAPTHVSSTLQRILFLNLAGGVSIFISPSLPASARFHSLLLNSPGISSFFPLLLLAWKDIKDFLLVAAGPVFRNSYFLSIMGDGTASYIRMVQHLIEKCLICHMSQEECVEALSKHANIKPVITTTGVTFPSSSSAPFTQNAHDIFFFCSSSVRTRITGLVPCDNFLNCPICPTGSVGSCDPVWKELEKENKEFFEAYAREKQDQVFLAETMQRIQKLLSESASKDPDE